MIVRKIKPAETLRVRQLSALAFEYALSGEAAKGAADAYDASLLAQPETRRDMNRLSQWAAFEDDDRTMMSTFCVIPFPARFDGHEVIMTGIGDVATLPPYRRRGGIRACFERALPDMYASGATLSYLYPFSTAYYRKFGYDNGCERNCWRLQLAHMPARQTDGCCTLLERGADLEADIRAVDRVWQEKYNLMVLDGDVEYAWVKQADPFTDRAYTFVYRAKDGAPKGYMTFVPRHEQEGRPLECTRFCFADLEGFHGLLNLLLSMKADHAVAVLRLPVDIPLYALLPEHSFGAAACTREPFGMVRVVNAEKALRLARTRGAGEAVIRLHDAQIPQNDGCFRIRWADGGVQTIERTDAPADAEMTVGDFSSLLAGRYDADEIAYMPGVRLTCGAQKLAGLFYRKPTYICRYF